MKRAERHSREHVRYVRNILRSYRAATRNELHHGGAWYAREHDALAALARDLGLPTASVCGAAAAISPGMRWDLVAHYVRLLARDDWQRATVPTYAYSNVRKARACLEGQDPSAVLGGPKVLAFYELLITRAGSAAVVIDGHAFNIARRARVGIRGGQDAPRVGPALYKRLERAYQRAAEIAGTAPHAMQATTWLQWRNERGVA
jgi:hypothetical protein